MKLHSSSCLNVVIIWALLGAARRNGSLNDVFQKLLHILLPLHIELVTWKKSAYSLMRRLEGKRARIAQVITSELLRKKSPQN